MSRKPKRQATDKVIHIRMDEKTHLKLMMHAASSRASIQQLVEELIRANYKKMRIGNVKP